MAHFPVFSTEYWRVQMWMLAISFCTLKAPTMLEHAFERDINSCHQYIVQENSWRPNNLSEFPFLTVQHQIKWLQFMDVFGDFAIWLIVADFMNLFVNVDRRRTMVSCCYLLVNSPIFPWQILSNSNHNIWKEIIINICCQQYQKFSRWPFSYFIVIE